MTVAKVVSQRKAEKYASVIISVQSKPPKNDTQIRLLILFWLISFNLLHPKYIKGERSNIPKKCSKKTIFIAGNS